MFIVTTTAAMMGAAWRPLGHIWDSFDPLAALLVVTALPLLPLFALLAILPFAYRRPVMQIATQRAQTSANEGNAQGP
jgi:hypothetical protein